ncbi:YslB family protein [Microaerobacter geothermalis]|uniref:DUF2507 domain-containing protein n=1 Tax=Microaerobacter geothermalis TaxID=674972 RepID=UPI001F2328B6|nr:DUF2507 domain-containing protein [Microaerobacter geothermalis]MCF6092617.1 YslB family protein [Microaerobacter geothermalis]
MSVLNGFLFFRGQVLQDILGSREKIILYWVGKNSARHFHVTTMEEMQKVFDNLGLGKIKLVKDKATESQWILEESPLLQEKIKNEDSLAFECGLLAGLLESIYRGETAGDYFSSEKEGKKELIITIGKPLSNKVMTIDNSHER